ncbi:hypothetical protein HanXRQr2_Chr01g0035731 [Helianthus annuus]|uniref:Uncharacterized protein n=1 Tax=Helianthus annuus TaxID=4232 RepID=A0A9K3JYW1_HELAN|nr:hypothetical protein HanXRQr2_Chr01g0035731 [Helianthus annuus]
MVHFISPLIPAYQTLPKFLFEFGPDLVCIYIPNVNFHIKNNNLYYIIKETISGTLVIILDHFLWIIII